MRLYHGDNKGKKEIFLGQCWTDEIACAEHYAQGGNVILFVDVQLSELSIEECDDYDCENDETPADDPEYRSQFDCDVLVYDDVDTHGLELTCYRLNSEKAVKYFAQALGGLEE